MAVHSLPEIDHQLEKLEFYLALSQAIGDHKKSDRIKSQIDLIEHEVLEPGT